MSKMIDEMIQKGRESFVSYVKWLIVITFLV